MRYADPNTEKNSKISFKRKYDNFIGGKWVAPVKGEYFDNISPVNGKPLTKVAKSTLKTSNWHWTLHTPQRPNGMPPLPQNAQTYC